VNDSQDNQHLASTSLWPIGFAIGIACMLVGLVISVAVLVVGAVIAVAFGWLWMRDLLGKRAPEPAEPGEPATAAELEEFDRATFLSVSTLGLGAVIGAAVTVPALGFMVLPSFMGEGIETGEVDLGPISNFPEGTYVITTYTEVPRQGDVSRRTAFVRNNGPREEDGVPSFSILFSRCVHLGCPVQPNGPFEGDPISYQAEGLPEVTLQPVLAASFGCPCHGGQYDSEGNRTAGPPVRSLDRYEFSIVNGNLVLGRLFSVGTVEGTGANATIAKYYRAYPGVHVDGIERFLYPIPTPGSRG
jgi:Rieske Fe-S protein